MVMLKNNQVFYVANDVVQLASCLYVGKNNPTKTLVVFSHGFSHSSTMSEHARLFVEMADILTDELDLDALLFDYEGHGISSGLFKSASPNLRIKNLNLIVDWARERYEHVVLLGFSMGGAVSIYVAAERMVEGLITWNAVPTFLSSAPSSTWFQKEPEVGMCEHHGKIFLEDRPKEDVKDVYARVVCPKLHVQGTNDYPYFEEEFSEVFDCAPSNKKKILIEGASHVFEKVDHRKYLFSSTVHWLKDLLDSFDQKVGLSER